MPSPYVQSQFEPPPPQPGSHPEGDVTQPDVVDGERGKVNGSNGSMAQISEEEDKERVALKAVETLAEVLSPLLQVVTPSRAGRGPFLYRCCRSYLKPSVDKVVCKSQFPQKFVNFLFMLGIVKDKLTDFWGS